MAERATCTRFIDASQDLQRTSLLEIYKTTWNILPGYPRSHLPLHFQTRRGPRTVLRVASVKLSFDMVVVNPWYPHVHVRSSYQMVDPRGFWAVGEQEPLFVLGGKWLSSCRNL